jgi:hypothetical protein
MTAPMEAARQSQWPGPVATSVTSAIRATNAACKDDEGRRCDRGEHRQHTESAPASTRHGHDGGDRKKTDHPRTAGFPTGEGLRQERRNLASPFISRAASRIGPCVVSTRKANQGAKSEHVARSHVATSSPSPSCRVGTMAGGKEPALACTQESTSIATTGRRRRARFHDTDLTRY